MEAVAQLSWMEIAEPDKNAKSYFDRLLDLLNTSDSFPSWPDAFGLALKAWVRDALQIPIRTLSLFSGGGGLDIAFHDAGFTVTHMIEVDARYSETLTLNSQQGRRLEGSEPLCIDIKDFDPPEDLNIDFIIGGPPCQTFSAAGRRAAGVSGVDDPRGVLFQEYVRILKKLQPKGFLFENVYGILGAQRGRPWKDIVKAFELAGYNISYRILDASDYGVPQQRERLIIVGTRDGHFAFPQPTHGPDSSPERPYYTSGLAIQGIEGSKPGPVGGRYGYLLKDIPPGLNYSFYTEEMGHPSPIFSWRSKFSDLLYKADPGMPVRTIKAQGGQYTGPFHWENRPFNIDELKRLQTFPDDYIVVGGRQVAMQQIGNSVPPQFGRILAIAILNQLFDVSFPFGIECLSPTQKLGFRQRKASLTSFYQQKAKEAIAKQYPLRTVISDDGKSRTVNNGATIHTFAAYLGPDFVWNVSNDCTQEYPWNVEFAIVQRERLIELNVKNKGDTPKPPAVTIEISPTREWKVPADKVHLLIQSPSPDLFTAAWKAFEHYLIKEGIKADLVQLNGYYQYKPAMRMELVKLETSQTAQDSFWIVLHNVLKANGVRRIISLGHLANLWNLPLEATIDSLIRLRKVGYEIRSSYTNDQIPPEHVLIPYAFPTLNPLSVQLRKVLFPQSILELVAQGKKFDEKANEKAT